MDSRDRANAVTHLIDVLRRITRVTQIIPFVYLLFLALCLLAESIFPELAKRLLDEMLSASIYVIICMFALGRILRLCGWFITAILLPLLPKVIKCIDSFIITMWREEIIFADVVVGMTYLLFLFFAYHHFFIDHGRKERTA